MPRLNLTNAEAARLCRLIQDTVPKDPEFSSIYDRLLPKAPEVRGATVEDLLNAVAKPMGLSIVRRGPRSFYLRWRNPYSAVGPDYISDLAPMPLKVRARDAAWVEAKFYQMLPSCWSIVDQPTRFWTNPWDTARDVPLSMLLAVAARDEAHFLQLLDMVLSRGICVDPYILPVASGYALGVRYGNGGRDYFTGLTPAQGPMLTMLWHVSRAPLLMPRAGA